jgi:Leucine-rich repeat (LRR) protein
MKMTSSTDNSSSSFTKHFDSKNASFYYHDSVSNTTTWDKPLAEMAIYRSEYDLKNIAAAKIKDSAKKQEMIRHRKEIFDEFHKEREHELRIEREEFKENEFKRIHGFWRVAALDASTSGQLSISWNKELLFIDPLVYNFHENFGRFLVTLRLVGLSLTSLPDEFALKLTSLECLSLASNQLTSLPDNFTLLTNLQELNLLNNRLVSLPERIGLMCSLKNIEIANNCIKALPITFAALDKLIRVNFECNHLKVLPENLDNMLRCRSLNFNNNRLIRLPRCLARMPSLVSLSASKNAISYIPQELSDSSTLRIIRLSANKIKFIPVR